MTTEPTEQQPRDEGLLFYWVLLVMALIASGLLLHAFTSNAKIAASGHRLFKVVHSPTTKEERPRLGKVVYVTGMENDVIDSAYVGNLYACKVPDQVYEWAEYMDTIQLRPSECVRLAP